MDRICIYNDSFSFGFNITQHFINALRHFYQFFFKFYYLIRRGTDLKKFCIWVFLGAFLIIFSLFKETFLLCQYMITDKGKFKENLKGISKENYILLRRIFLKFYKQGKEIINLSDVIFYIKAHHQDLEKK